MKRPLVMEALSLLVLGAAAMYGGVGLYLNRDIRTQSSVLAPGVYILVLAGLLLGTALLYVWLSSGRRVPAGTTASTATSGSWMSPIVVKMIGAFAIYAYLIELVGYLAPTLLFLFVEFRLLGVKSWKTNAILTALVTALFYVIFIYYCEMVFPRGSLFE
ncbi:MAG: tripartite tricarboxylate transporter TctB family protein [Candidatus Methylomirabilales bacterium]